MPSSGDLPRPGMEPAAPGAPASQADSRSLSCREAPPFPGTTPTHWTTSLGHRTVSCRASPGAAAGERQHRRRRLVRRGRSPEAPAAARGVQPLPAGRTTSRFSTLSRMVP